MSAVDDLGIPHFGIPRRDLTAAQLRERATAVRALSPEDRELYDREVGRVHGLRRSGAMHRSDGRFLDPDEERAAIESLRRHGLAFDLKGDPLTGEALRRKARTWLESEAAALNESATRDPHAAPTDVDKLMAFHEAEAKRWREAARMDRERAEQHDRIASEHEGALTDLHFLGSDA
jgi:hypothetical protein